MGISSLSYMPMHDMLIKAKGIKILLNMVEGDIGVIGCISKVIVPIKQLWFGVS